jgi:hypothetical protein
MQLRNLPMLILFGIIATHSGVALSAKTNPTAAGNTTPTASTESGQGSIMSFDLAHRRIVIDQKEYALADQVLVTGSDNSPWGQSALRNNFKIEYSVDNSGSSNHTMQGNLPVITKIRIMSKMKDAH